MQADGPVQTYLEVSISITKATGWYLKCGNSSSSQHGSLFVFFDLV
jgi:hypothetical protein